MSMRRLFIILAVMGVFIVGCITALFVWANHENHKFDKLTDTHDLKSRIEKLAAKHLAKCPESALAIAVHQRGPTSFQGFGKVSTANTNAPDALTFFEIGSITKVFTATVLAKMVDDGSVKLDDPISLYLPKNVSSPQKNGREITLVHLATHTSGLPRLPGNLFSTAKDQQNPYADFHAPELYESLAHVKLATEPGKKSSYSNYGFGLLGHILELKSGMPYESLVKEIVCDPLGLNNTVIQLSTEQKARLAEGHDAKCSVTKNWDFDVIAPAGALRSNTADMLKFVEANLAETNSISKILADTRKVHFKGFLRSIGLGWQIETVDDPVLIWHNGGTGGYRSFIGFDRKNQIGVVVLSSFTEDVDSMALEILKTATKISLE